MAKTFRTCILHIGTEKTGTTTLQAFLSLNRQALLQKGIFVPASLSPYPDVANHERLTTYSLNGDKLQDDLRLAAGVRTAEEVEQHRQDVATALQREFEQVPAGCDTLLLSNEHCHSRLTGLDEVLRLKRLLSSHAEQIKILVYIRPQHELAASLYDQALRAGYSDISVLPDFEATVGQWVDKGYFDYADLTSRWSLAFSPENMTVRIFSPAELADSDVVADAMEQIGCDMMGLERPPKQNTSIGRDLQPVLNAINRVANRRRLGLSAALRDQIADRLRQLSSTPGRQPARDDAIAFFDLFRDSNELVRLTYFPDRADLFSPDFSRLPETTPAEVQEVDLLAETIINLVASGAA